MDNIQVVTDEHHEQAEDKRPRLESDDGEFDEELALPDPISIIDIGDGPVAIALSDDEVEAFGKTGRSFSTIHNKPVKFNSFSREVFIPGEDIYVSITHCERNLTTHLLNPNLYTISLTHGPFTWDIKKRYKQLQNLHQQLIIFRTSLNFPLPTKTHKNKRNYVKDAQKKMGEKKKKRSLPRFPKKPEVLVSYDKLESRQRQLEDYLNNLLSIRIYRNHPATIEFLELSQISFVIGLGKKGKEGMLKKKNGSTVPGQSGCNCFGLISCWCCRKCQLLKDQIFCARWSERWFFVKDTYFGYINPNDGRINAVILFDQGFEVGSGMYSVGLHTGFQILTMSRQITFKSWTKRKCKEWIEALKETAGTTAREFVLSNRHRSYAPVRNSITASWFVDGKSYMSSVADALENAKEEIFITDWWLSPEIYLKRPVIDGHYWRLDNVLKRKASQGVKVFILLYKEVELALGLNSYYSKQTLMHDNIKVLRHPDHAKVGVFLWAHHEKMVVVDQNYAFVGGIDLCYGRWDDDKHRLTDLGSINAKLDTTQRKKKTSSTPEGGKIYPIPKPVYIQTPIPPVKPNTPEEDKSDPLETPTLEPGDSLLRPPPLDKLKCNTPESNRKNVLVNLKKTMKKGKNLINLSYNPNETDQCEKNDNGEMEEEEEDLLDGSTKLWTGKDYVNFIVQDFSSLDKPFDDFIDRYTTPRMPWHDIGMCVVGKAAKDIARHFIHRWNNTKLEKAKFNEQYPYLLPKSYDEFKALPINMPNGCYEVTCQALRSVSTWSCGFLEPDTVEQSIHEAYIQCITMAQHYIYIENQFFISLSFHNPNTQNRIGDELYKRIVRAHKAREVFRVYVVIPLLPGFEGEVGGTTGTSLHAITHWNYASISRGKDALLNRLREAGINDPSQYISFYGLRNHEILNDEPITELIYVHSKLMIVDDKLVICGSANINDRSLIGKRDSEIAVLIEDETFEDGVMNGQPYKCGKFAGSLRKYLFKEHLGILGKESENINIDVSDPIIDSFYKEIWYNTATLNTELYEKVFHCIPTDKVETFSQLREYKQEEPYYTTETARAQKMLDTIQGHIVLLPLKFLSQELLTPSANSMEGIMPTALWT
ncbi:phospholipase D2 isoform X3 [Coccinella septempunctata]|nr:phospholipase D2 isoform X3 [Coccinella septempunctata]XP_044748827.1 phospholipase D2 isoform X3 [Coccinella septempunctata]